MWVCIIKTDWWKGCSSLLHSIVFLSFSCRSNYLPCTVIPHLKKERYVSSAWEVSVSVSGLLLGFGKASSGWNGVALLGFACLGIPLSDTRNRSGSSTCSFLCLEHPLKPGGAGVGVWEQLNEGLCLLIWVSFCHFTPKVIQKNEFVYKCINSVFLF